MSAASNVGAARRHRWVRGQELNMAEVWLRRAETNVRLHLLSGSMDCTCAYVGTHTVRTRHANW